MRNPFFEGAAVSRPGVSRSNARGTNAAMKRNREFMDQLHEKAIPFGRQLVAGARCGKTAKPESQRQRKDRISP